MPHKPVLAQEVVHCLNLGSGMTVVDGTVGSGGHAIEILKKIGPQGKLIALDQDPEAITRCQMLLQPCDQVVFQCENFRNLGKVLDLLNISYVDAVILDIGFSSDQLEDGRRGFSFEREGPLDMRMSPAGCIRARDLVHDLSQQELENLFRGFGEERWSRRFARAICRERKKKNIETTLELARVIETALPGQVMARKERRSFHWRRHPATKVFQALRIAVNDELGALREGLFQGWKKIRVGGRLGVITFHSLEDRIVKNQFRSWKQAEEANLVTRKPMTASRVEIDTNPRARSAKLRAVEKIYEGSG